MKHRGAKNSRRQLSEHFQAFGYSIQLHTSLLAKFLHTSESDIIYLDIQGFRNSVLNFHVFHFIVYFYMGRDVGR
jgi:hypothetical protein